MQRLPDLRAKGSSLLVSGPPRPADAENEDKAGSVTAQAARTSRRPETTCARSRRRSESAAPTS